MDVKLNEYDDWNNMDLPIVTFVWAEDKNGLIGNNDELPWSLPADMKHFKTVTSNGVVVMGRKTFESIPNPPLKNRLNIVLTNNTAFQADGAIVCHNKQEVLDYLKENNIKKSVHIIGGRSIYQLFLDEVNVLYRTIIDEAFPGDTYMPEISYKYFRCLNIVDGIVDERNLHPHRYYTYERKQFVPLF